MRRQAQQPPRRSRRHQRRSSRPGSEAGEDRSTSLHRVECAYWPVLHTLLVWAWKENSDGAGRAGFIWMVGNSSRKPLPQSLNGRFAHNSARSSRHMPSDDGQILRNQRSHPMTAADFRRIALSLEGVEEYSHAGLPAFRVGGRKFASLASQAEGYGNLMLTLEQQAAFVEEAPEIFLPIPGGWGKMGHTRIRLAASEEVLTGALRTAWKLRIDKNAKTSRKKNHVAERSGVTDKKRGKRRL